MKKLLVTLMIAASAASMVAVDANAKRMGGGSSIGKQSQSVSRQPAAPMQQQAAPQPARQAAPAAAPQAPAAKPSMPWKSMLGGALLGLGLGALFSHLGLSGAMAGMLSSLLMIALLAAAGYFIFRMLRRKSGDSAGPRPAYAGAAGAATPEIGSRLEPALSSPAARQAEFAGGGAAANVAEAVPVVDVPAGFDVQGFLRHAKTYFIRLQAAWDKADINDLKEFTSPEMYAELKLQLQERGPSTNHTDVVSLDAELAAMEQIGDQYMASVRFSGMIREAENAPAEAFAEVWNLVKPASGQGGWVLAGIQQLS
ncbi:Tim44 domain-containing protein [Noviherbaspirillum galbum]|uniref:Tim44 domain-containing protein n=1 Tax=Noviherbaspirillum galbum TaxID=2709383 RepID=A0A6B3SWW6_9BURK|nr:Tim44-like domain-containing protein [Noviherbaspirillum galbum]NEX62922.1 Tim44 domain-containing protein [Noviherbaspirillum galbum]